MALRVEHLPGNFGAMICGIDIRAAGWQEVRELFKALLEHRFIVLHGQKLTNTEYLTFARQWGRPIRLIARKNTLENFPEIIVQHNRLITPDYVRNVANHWHCDSSYEAEVATTTMLYGVESPEQDGATLFADLVAAYEALPEVDQARYDDMMVNHATSAATPLPDEHISDPRALPEEMRRNIVQLDPVTHPLIRRHPVTGRNALYGLGGSAYAIEGLSAAEGSELILDLRRHATQEHFCARYKLMPGDVLIWDNLSVMHRATPIEYSDDVGKRRLNYRISLKGLPVQEGILNAPPVTASDRA